MKLPERDRKIMMMRYGLFGRKKRVDAEKMSLLKLGSSQSYISRIEKKVIRKLKNSVKSADKHFYFCQFSSNFKKCFFPYGSFRDKLLMIERVNGRWIF